MEATIKHVITNNIAIKEKTGKELNEWLDVLRKYKNDLETHLQKVEFLKQEYNLTVLWSENIVREYEKLFCKRVNIDYEIIKNKTFECKIDKLYNFMKNLFTNPAFEFFPTELLNDNLNKNIKIKCSDKSHIITYFYSKENKTQLIIQHTKLKNTKVYEDIRKFWMRKLREIEKEIID